MASQDIAQNLRDNNNNWRAVKQAIENRGVSTTGKTTADYDELIGQIGGGGNLDTLNVTPTTSQQTLTPTSPVDGWDEVVVAAVDASIDSNIVAGNIKSGVSILGVTGEYSGGGSNYQSKNVIPTAAGLTVTPDTGYDALSSVVIAGSSNLIASNVKKDVEIFGVTGTLESGGVALNPHPTSLAYAGSGDTNNNSHSDILPAAGSWTKAVDLTNLNASNGFRYVFYNNTTISSLDLRNWNFENITDARYSFNGCSNLVTIQGTLRFDKCTTYTNMFTGCSKLVGCPITNFGFGVTTNTLTLDLSASSVLNAETMITNMETNSSGKTRILKLHADVLAGLSAEITALAASKNITLQ